MRKTLVCEISFKKDSLIYLVCNHQLLFHRSYLFTMVAEAGLEPARSCLRGILSPLCLPIPPLGLIEVHSIYFFLKRNPK